MSSTTEAPRRRSGGRIVAFAAGAVLTACGAFGLFAIVFAFTGQAPAALVFPPPEGGPLAMPDGVSLLRWTPTYAIVTGESPDYVRRLYGKGALMVLPVRRNGCLDLRK